MKINSLEHYKEVMQTRKVRVERDTLLTIRRTDREALIGKTLDVRFQNYNNNTIEVWNEDKSDSWTFNTSDVTEMMSPFEYRFGFGDKVKLGNWAGEYTVIGTILHGDGLKLLCIKQGNIRCTYSFEELNTLTLISPSPLE